MKKNILVIFFFLPLVLNSQVQRDTINFYVFGLSLRPNFSSFGHYYHLYQPRKQDSIKFYEFIGRDDFIWQAMGEQQSKANLKAENFLKQYGVCPQEESNQVCYYRLRTVLANIWRLRYKEYPYDWDSLYTDHKGWAGDCCRPTPAQMQYLYEHYKMDTTYFLVKGKYLFYLLRDMQSRDWIENYKNLADDN